MAELRGVESLPAQYAQVSMNDELEMVWCAEANSSADTVNGDLYDLDLLYASTLQEFVTTITIKDASLRVKQLHSHLRHESA